MLNRPFFDENTVEETKSHRRQERRENGTNRQKKLQRKKRTESEKRKPEPNFCNPYSVAIVAIGHVVGPLDCIEHK